MFDKALTEQRYRDMAMRRLSARSMKDDAITAGVLPMPGRTPSIGVLYDATGFWICGIVGMVNRTLSVQIAATLGKRHDAALLDMRDVLSAPPFRCSRMCSRTHVLPSIRLFWSWTPQEKRSWSPR